MTHPERRGGDPQVPLTDPAAKYWHREFPAAEVKEILAITPRNLDYWTCSMSEHSELLSDELSETINRGSGVRRAYHLTDIANLGLVKFLHVQPLIDHEFDISALCELLARPPVGCESWARLAFEATQQWDDQVPYAFLRDGELSLVRGWFGVAEFTDETISAAYVNISQLGREIIAGATNLAPTSL